MKISQQFLEKYGIDLENVLPDGDFPQNKVQRFFEQQKEMLILFCNNFNIRFNYDNLKEKQKSVFDQAILEQMYYVLNTYDYRTVSTLDIATGTTIPVEEVENRYIAASVKNKLKQYGFCYRGLY